MVHRTRITNRDSQRGARAAILAGAACGFFISGLTSLLIGTVLFLIGPKFDSVIFSMIRSPLIAMSVITISGVVLGAYCGSVLSRRAAIGASRRGEWQPVLTGAVCGWVGFGLTSLLIVAAFLIREWFHPILWVATLIAIPAITIVGGVLGAMCGIVVCLVNKAKKRTAAVRPPGAVAQLLLRGALLYGVGVTVIVSGTLLWAVVKNQPFARLESLGARLDYVAAVVSFPDGTLGNAELPAVIECLNQLTKWRHLILSGTAVSGDGLRHLQSLSVPGFSLGLSHNQLDEAGLNHLSRLQNLSYLCVTGGPVAPAARLQVQQALPNVPRIDYQEEFQLPF